MSAALSVFHKMSNLQRKLEVINDAQLGPVLKLDDWEHKDYIEDVLAEHFDIEYDYSAQDEETGNYSLYFLGAAELDNIQKAVETINSYHSSSKELYATI